MIYYAVRDSDGAIKIGTSEDVARRLTELSVDQGCDVRLLATEPGGYATESRIHRIFSAFRLRDPKTGWSTEWFRPEEALSRYIDGLVDKPIHISPVDSMYAERPVQENADTTDFVEDED